MESLSIAGLGVVGGFGCGHKAFLDALETPALCQNEVTIPLQSSTARLYCFRADPAPLTDYFSSRLLRRINRFGKIVTLAAQQALATSGLGETLDRSRLGLVLATGYGSSATTFEFLDSYHEDGNTYVSPMTFSNSVHASAMSTASILLQITGPTLTVNQLESSVPMALHTARLWLESGRVDHVLVGGSDEYCDVLGYTYASLFGSSPGNHIDIRNIHAQTAFPGEAAAFLLLSRDTGLANFGFLRPASASQTGAQSVPDLRVIGFDGHKHCGRGYSGYYADRAVPTVSFANATGSMPTAPMLDVVAAATMIKANRMCHSDFSIRDSLPTLPALNSIEIIKIDQDAMEHRIIVSGPAGTSPV